jgi:hypothetical protein
MSIKRVLVLLVAALSLPASAIAQNKVGFTSVGGSIQSSGSPDFVLSTATTGGGFLTTVTGFNGGDPVSDTNLGAITFRTGQLLSGNLQTGALFSGIGSLVITSNGSDGLPAGTMFQGGFDGPISWTMVRGLIDNTPVCYYVLSGSIHGVYYNNRNAHGTATILTLSSSHLFNGIAALSGANVKIHVN